MSRPRLETPLRNWPWTKGETPFPSANTKVSTRSWKRSAQLYGGPRQLHAGVAITGARSAALFYDLSKLPSDPR